MKKKGRIFWIVCASLLALGFVCLIIGFATGAGKVGFRTGLINGIVINEFDFKDAYSKDSYSWNLGAKNKSIENQSKQFEDVKELEIDVNIGEVDIVLHDEPYIEVISNYDTQQQELTITQDQDKLRVQSRVYARYKVGSHISVGHVRIYVPKDVEFATVNIETGAGDLYIENIQAEEFDLSVGAGRAIIDNLNVGEFILDVGAGEIKAMNVQVEEEGSAICGVGLIDMRMSGMQEDYNYQIALGIGNIQIGGNNYSGLGAEKKIDNHARKDLEFDCGVGSIEVRFEK